MAHGAAEALALGSRFRPHFLAGSEDLLGHAASESILSEPESLPAKSACVFPLPTQCFLHAAGPGKL